MEKLEYLKKLRKQLQRKKSFASQYNFLKKEFSIKHGFNPFYIGDVFIHTRKEINDRSRFFEFEDNQWLLVKNIDEMLFKVQNEKGFILDSTDLPITKPIKENKIYKLSVKKIIPSTNRDWLLYIELNIQINRFSDNYSWKKQGIDICEPFVTDEFCLVIENDDYQLKIDISKDYQQETKTKILLNSNNIDEKDKKEEINYHFIPIQTNERNMIKPIIPVKKTKRIKWKYPETDVFYLSQECEGLFSIYPTIRPNNFLLKEIKNIPKYHFETLFKLFLTNNDPWHLHLEASGDMHYKRKIYCHSFLQWKYSYDSCTPNIFTKIPEQNYFNSKSYFKKIQGILNFKITDDNSEIISDSSFEDIIKFSTNNISKLKTKKPLIYSSFSYHGKLYVITAIKEQRKVHVISIFQISTKYSLISTVYELYKYKEIFTKKSDRLQGIQFVDNMSDLIHFNVEGELINDYTLFDFEKINILTDYKYFFPLIASISLNVFDYNDFKIFNNYNQKINKYLFEYLNKDTKFSKLHYGDQKILINNLIDDKVDKLSAFLSFYENLSEYTFDINNLIKLIKLYEDTKRTFEKFYEHSYSNINKHSNFMKDLISYCGRHYSNNTSIINGSLLIFNHFKEENIEELSSVIHLCFEYNIPVKDLRTFRGWKQLNLEMLTDECQGYFERTRSLIETLAQFTTSREEFENMSEEELQKEIKKIELKIKNNFDSRSFFNKNYDNFTFLLPSDIVEIKKEGRMQSNCVAMFITQHINNDMTLVFMRPTHNLEESYITMRFKDNILLEFEKTKRYYNSVDKDDLISIYNYVVDIDGKFNNTIISNLNKINIVNLFNDFEIEFEENYILK